MADKIRTSNKDVSNFEPSDSESDISETDKQLLNKVRKRYKNDSESDEEVYAFSESDESENELSMADSDVEGQEGSDDNLPSSKAWGKKKQVYYSTDYIDEDYGGFQGDEETALMEEEEARAIQKRLLEQLDEDDFCFDTFTKQQTTATEVEASVIKSDLSELSKRQKQQLFEKESPEFASLVSDFKNKLKVAKDDLKPVITLVKGGKIPQCPAYKFVQTNYDLILNYCINISFYLLLKSKRINIRNHPVVKKLYQYRQMLNEVEPIYNDVIKPQIELIMKAVKENEDLPGTSKKRKKHNLDNDSISKKLRLVNNLEKAETDDTGVSDNECEELNTPNRNDETEAFNNSEESGFSDDESDEEQQKFNKSHNDENAETSLDINEPEKREITYQIAKNKGLTPHRKKEQRNPRVKHKLKYRKAKIRRKGAIREVRKEVNRYGGEVTGIKANIRKSIKIK